MKAHLIGGLLGLAGDLVLIGLVLTAMDTHWVPRHGGLADLLRRRCDAPYHERNVFCDEQTTPRERESCWSSSFDRHAECVRDCAER